MDHVRVEIDGRVAIVTLDRPPVNALDSQTFAELAEAFGSLGHARDVNVAIFTGGTAKTFCGGVDLEDSPRRYRPDGRREDGGPKGDAVDQLDPGHIARRCFFGIYDCAVPVIGAIHGHAVGAGLAMVASCDFVVASTEATFSLTEINVGVLGGVRHTMRLLGPMRARRLFFTGERISAAELYRVGAIEEVVAPEDLMATARRYADVIAAKSPIAVRLAKESANRVEDMALREGYRLEQDYTARVNRYADAGEARRAYLDKRPVNFSWE